MRKINSDKNNMNKKIKNNRNLIYLVITTFIIFILLIVIYFSRNSKDEKPIVKEMNTQEKISIINKTLSKKMENLHLRIKDYISKNKLDSSKISVIYGKINDNPYNFDERLVPMRNYNLFILSMLLDDLSNNGQINLDDKISLEKIETEEKLKEISLYELIKQIITDMDYNYLPALENYIEIHLRGDWRNYANKLYGIKINSKNEMSNQDIHTILEKLLTKTQSKYLYKNTLSFMMESAKNNNSLNALNQRYFIASQTASSYNYSIDIGTVIGEDFYYNIYSGYSDLSIINDIRNIIFDWYDSYNIN